MSLEQRGLYIDMLCEAWDSDPPGTLPNDHGRIATLLGVPLKRFQSIAGLVLEQFKVEGALLINKRMADERDKQVKNKQQQSDKGKAGAKARWQKDGHDDGTGITPAMAQVLPENGFAFATASAYSNLQSEEIPDDGIIAEIACAHPKNAAKDLTALEVPQNQLIAVIQAVGAEARRQGITNQQAAEWVLAKTRHVAKFAKESGKISFEMSPVKFFTEREYRKETEQVNGKSEQRASEIEQSGAEAARLLGLPQRGLAVLPENSRPAQAGTGREGGSGEVLSRIIEGGVRAIHLEPQKSAPANAWPVDRTDAKPIG